MKWIYLVAAFLAITGIGFLLLRTADELIGG
jgi:hypothetical protein